MIRDLANRFKQFLSPLDIVTILYLVITGIYFCFDSRGILANWTHLLIRLGIGLFIVSVIFLKEKFTENQIVLFVRNIYPIFFLGFFYTETNDMNNIIFPVDLDYYFYQAEQYLWHCQPSIIFGEKINQAWFNELMNMCYFSYYILIISVCSALYFKRKQLAPKSIFIVVFSFYLYYVIFDVLPVSGPQFYLKDVPTASIPQYFFGRIMEGILTDMEQPTGAFPSSHVGVAVILSILSFKHLKKMFFAIAFFSIGICFATVYIKAHYLIDVLAGLISAPIFVYVSGLVYNKLSSHPIDSIYHVKTD